MSGHSDSYSNLKGNAGNDTTYVVSRSVGDILPPSHRVGSATDPNCRHRHARVYQVAVVRAQGSKAPWVHTDEGDDDMPAHVKSSMFGASVSVPISNGRLNLGTWQVR